VAAACNESLGGVSRLFALPRTVASLDEPLSDREREPLSVLVGADLPGPEEEVAEAFRSVRAPRRVAEPPPQQREVVLQRFGFGTGDEASVLTSPPGSGLSPERVEALEEAALARLLRPLREAA
jgi:DNA-directed RNA polymerase sigma subunit (sigma70/sigma32)